MSGRPPTIVRFAAQSKTNLTRMGRRPLEREVCRGRRSLTLPIVLTLVAAVLAAPTAAHAHPLGNFSVNHLSTVRISDDRIEVRYLLDQAEIPTIQERGVSTPELVDRKRDEVLRGLELTVDGRPTPLELDGRGRGRG